jgi:EmrB/QacA subfamily drug resistance transporter
MNGREQGPQQSFVLNSRIPGTNTRTSLSQASLFNEISLIIIRTDQTGTISPLTLRRTTIMDEKKAALIVSTLASFLTPFMASSVNIALPSIGSEFSLDAISLSWVTTGFLVTAAIFLLPFGRVADIYGRKKVFTYGILLHTLSSVLAAVSFSGAMLIVSRALQGTGGAMIFGTGIAILTSVYPASERGKVLGFNVSSVYVGLSLGPVLGGILTQQLGWRSIFVVGIILGGVIIAFVTARLKGEWAEARGERFDVAEGVLFSFSLALVMYGFSELPLIRGTGTLIVGITLLIVFLIRESNTASPLLDTRLFMRNPAFAFSNLAALINYSATYAVTFLLSLYLQYLKGLTPQAAGFVLIFQPAVMALCSPLAGRLSDRIEPRIVASLGMAIIVVGLLLFVFIGTETRLPVIAAGLIVLGFGFGLFSSPNTNAVMSSVDKRSYGVASATLGTMRLTGQMVSLGIVMILFTAHIGKVTITPQYYPELLQSVKIAFMVFSALCLAGAFASLARGKIH